MTEQIFDHKLADMEWSVRARNCLLNNFQRDMSGQLRPNIKPLVTLRDLVQVNEAELLRVPNFGRKSLREVKEVLGSLGLHLGMDFSPPPPSRDVDFITLEDIFVLLASLVEDCRYPVTIEVIKPGARLRMRSGGNELTTFLDWGWLKELRRQTAAAILKRMEDSLDGGQA
jgi:hypothetical protein